MPWRRIARPAPARSRRAAAGPPRPTPPVRAAEPAGPVPTRRPRPGAPPPLPRALIEAPDPFLAGLTGAERSGIDLGGAPFLEMWALCGLAALARPAAERPGWPIRVDGAGPGAAFARAVGFAECAAGRPPPHPGRAGRTVTLRRLLGYDRLEPTAHEIAALVLPDPADAESRSVVRYVMIELLRNVIQHSRDPLGGVVAAQRMDAEQRYDLPCVQVAVADAGIGIPAAMRGLHPELSTPEAALEKSLRPHISGTFEEGLTGSAGNAGLGLFFVQEMAKLAGGRLLLASRGAGLHLQGSPDDPDRPTLRLLRPPGTGFPGTLVAFELPLGRVVDYDGLIVAVNRRALERTPRRAVHRWLRYEAPPPGAARFRLAAIAEDTAQAERLAAERLVPRILARRPVVLDFAGLDICTQSYLHALLFRPLRLAWAERTPIHVLHAAPAVRSGLDTLEAYALGG